MPLVQAALLFVPIFAKLSSVPMYLSYSDGLIAAALDVSGFSTVCLGMHVESTTRSIDNVHTLQVPLLPYRILKLTKLETATLLTLVAASLC